MTTLCLSDAFGLDELPPNAVLGREKVEPPAREDEAESRWLRSLVREPVRAS